MPEIIDPTPRRLWWCLKCDHIWIIRKLPPGWTPSRRGGLRRPTAAG